MLCPRVVAVWSAVRRRLIQTHTPVVALAPLSPEPLRLLALERELRLVDLLIEGIDDHPICWRRSLDRLLNESVLQRFLQHFGHRAGALEALVVPVWDALAVTRSMETWATLVGREIESLERDLRSLGVRSPRRFLTWLRILNAWPMLHAGASAGSAAVEVGYGAPPAFTRATHRFVGLPPSDAVRVSLDALVARAAADLVA